MYYITPCAKTMTSARKPEMHNELQRRQSMTEPWPYRQHAQNWRIMSMWFTGFRVMRADKQTD